VRAAPTMPSADFCRAFIASSPVLSRCCFRNHDTWQISRGKTQILPRIDAGFTKCTLVGVATHAVDRGLRGHVPARPECITPHIRFLFIALRFRLELPPHPASRRRTCPLASLRLYKPGTGTFTRLDSCHARHTRVFWKGALRAFGGRHPNLPHQGRERSRHVVAGLKEGGSAPARAWALQCALIAPRCTANCATNACQLPANDRFGHGSTWPRTSIQPCKHAP